LTDFQKVLKYLFPQKPIQWCRFVPFHVDGRTDERTGGHKAWQNM